MAYHLNMASYYLQRNKPGQAIGELRKALGAANATDRASVPAILKALSYARRIPVQS